MSAATDPLLDMIARFKTTEAVLNGSGDDDGPVRADFLAAYRALKAAPAATTKEGAIAALRLLLAELEHSEDPELAESLVSAAVAFLGKPEGTPATPENVADLEWEPWQEAPDLFWPLTDAEWITAINPTLVMVRLAWVSVRKTKAELIEIVDGMDEDMLRDLMEKMWAAQRFFAEHVKLLDTAEARLFCAASNVVLTDERSSRDNDH